MKNCTLLGCKSKRTKHVTSGPLLEVGLSKKCTSLWREAHFEVKMYKTHQVRTTFGSCDRCRPPCVPVASFPCPCRLVALWAEGQLARWTLCLKCHKKKWPEAGSGWVGRVGWVGEVGPGLSIPRYRQDGRKRNRWCIPKVVPAGGVHRHYVTEPTPDGTGSCGRYLLSFVIVFPPVQVGPLHPPPSRPRGPQRHAAGKGLLLSKKPPLSFPTQP